jgi:hypothetical protein
VKDPLGLDETLAPASRSSWALACLAHSDDGLREFSAFLDVVHVVHHRLTRTRGISPTAPAFWGAGSGLMLTALDAGSLVRAALWLIHGRGKA